MREPKMNDQFFCLVPPYNKEACSWWCCLQSCWEREGGKKREEGAIWQPAATEDSDQLAGSFFPVMTETTNNCAFLLSELVSLMSTSLHKPLQC